MELGRLGVWYPTDRLDAAQLAALARSVEQLGYGTFWYPESRGYESFSLAAHLLASTTTLNVGSSIANIYARDAFTAQRGMATLNALNGGRFILGLGVSHIPMVEGLRGHRYDKPIPAMRAYLDGIQKDTTEDWPIALAALGPKMLELAGKRTRGAVPYNVTPEHTALAKSILGPDKWLAVEQKVCVETDLARPAPSAGKNCPATWRCRTTPTTGCASASPRPTWPMAAATASSMPWSSRAMPRRSRTSCAPISPPAPPISASSPSMPRATSPPATPCSPRWPDT